MIQDVAEKQGNTNAEVVCDALAIQTDVLWDHVI